MVDAQPGFFALDRPDVSPLGPRTVEPVAGAAERELHALPAPPDTPREVPIARTSTSVPGIQLAQYASAEVIELEVGTTAVMRRTLDGAFNATQILKAAGLDRNRRQRALDHEIGSQFEKVQGGTNKYQGTWIPFNVAVSLSRQYNVFDQLAPLFEYDMTQRPALKQPDPAAIEERRRELKEQQELGLHAVQERRRELKEQEYAAPPATGSAKLGAAPQLAAPAAATPVPAPAPAPVSGPASGSASGPAPEDDALTTLPPLEPSPDLSEDVIDVSRDVVTELFITANSSEPRALAAILADHGAERVEVNVPIDDAGHTALHWAAALGRVALVADLMRHGADPRRGNRKGESPLVRAVLVTNNSDNSTFGDLLDQLFPSLHLSDTQGRTVLHHIALTAGIPGRSDASRYYLEALLEWAVRRRGGGGVSWLTNELVDVQDVNGDTALNIAARLGSRRIAQQLVDVGASVTTANRAGLKPTDFGIRASPAAESSASPSADSEPLAKHRRTGSRPPQDGAERRAELASNAHSAIKTLDERMQADLTVKDELLAAVHAQLKAASERLTTLEARQSELQTLKTRRKAAEARLASLVQSIDTENQRFYAENSHHHTQIAPEEMSASFDADQPFKIDVNSEDDLRLPPVLLQARLRAYSQNEQLLTELRDDLKATSLDSEAQFRKVVAQCTSSEESKVDLLLEDLLQAVAKGSVMQVDGQ